MNITEAVISVNALQLYIVWTEHEAVNGYEHTEAPWCEHPDSVNIVNALKLRMMWTWSYKWICAHLRLLHPHDQMK